MKENNFEEGGSMNSFGENYDYNGDIFTSNHQYKIYGGYHIHYTNIVNMAMLILKLMLMNQTL